MKRSRVDRPRVTPSGVPGHVFSVRLGVLPCAPRVALAPAAASEVLLTRCAAEPTVHLAILLPHPHPEPTVVRRAVELYTSL